MKRTAGCGAGFDQILDQLILAVDGDGAAAGEVLEIDAMAAAFEGEPDSAVAHALAAEAVADSGFDQQVDGRLFEDAGAHSLDDIIAAATFDDGRFDAVEMEEMTEQQARGTGANDSHLRAGLRHSSNGMILGVTSYPRVEPSDRPRLLYPPYTSTIRRAPLKPLIPLPHTVSELTGPLYGHNPIGETDNDLTRQHAGEPVGERIIVAGRVIDEDGRAIPHTLIELWQCNAAGRYWHSVDNHPAPLDPNFSGAGRTMTDENGIYRFVTIKPGAYPWRNHQNAWRPAHIHFSLFGPCFLTRLITQMYFPNDPLMAFDPISQSIPDERARRRLVSEFDMTLTEPEWALAYRFDFVLRGRDATPFEGRR